MWIFSVLSGVEIVLKCTLTLFLREKNLKKPNKPPHYLLNNCFQINSQVARYSSSFIKVELGCKDFSGRVWQSPVQAGREPVATAAQDFQLIPQHIARWVLSFQQIWL